MVVVGGARAGRGAGVWRLAVDQPRDLVRDIDRATSGTLPSRGYSRGNYLQLVIRLAIYSYMDCCMQTLRP